MKSTYLLYLLSGFLMLSCNDGKQNGENSQNSEPVEQTRELEKVLSDNENFLIENKAAGDFQLADPIPASPENYSISKTQQTRTTEEGPTEETVYVVRQGDEVLMELLPSIEPATGEPSGKIGEMRLISDKFTTAEGIGIGSSLEEFINAYPNYKLWYTYVSNRYVLEAEALKAQFLLGEEDFTGEVEVSGVMTPLEKEDFRQAAEIKGIRIY